MMTFTPRRYCGPHFLVLITFIVALLATPLLAKEPSGGGYLGIGFSVDRGTGVLTVRQILPDSPAAVAEVRVADELVQVDKEDVRFRSHRAALEFLSEKARVGVSLALTVVRGGSRLELNVVPVEAPLFLAPRNERALRCADGASRQEDVWSSVSGSVP